MPPKAKISQQMIIDAGLKVVRSEGAENLNVRRIAAELGCSTQPVMYHYASVQDLRSDIYQAADELHSRYILALDAQKQNPMLTIGLNYIRFACEERHLFRFLFQSDQFHNASFMELMDADGLHPLLQPLSMQTGLNEQQAKAIFAALFSCVHGAASLLANNSIEYDAAYYTELLTTVFTGSIAYLKG